MGGVEEGSGRRDRLSGDAQRTIRVVTVRKKENDHRVAPGSARPYLVMVLQRTYDFLRQHLAADVAGAVDVLEFSQDFVDAAYSKNPADLLDEEKSFHAAEEHVDESRRVDEAMRSKASLGTRNDKSGPPLLEVRQGRRSGVTWDALSSLTERNDDEELMRTRYIERDPLVVLVFDSSGESSFWDPGSKTHVELSSDVSVQQLAEGEPADILPLFSRWRMSVAYKYDGVGRSAVEQTLQGRVWKPHAKQMSFVKPLDLAQVGESHYYDPIVGLTVREEDEDGNPSNAS